MSWFGWLTKPMYLITALDRAVEFIEIAGLIVVLLIIYGFIASWMDKK